MDKRPRAIGFVDYCIYGVAALEKTKHKKDGRFRSCLQTAGGNGGRVSDPAKLMTGALFLTTLLLLSCGGMVAPSEVTGSLGTQLIGLACVATKAPTYCNSSLVSQPEALRSSTSKKFIQISANIAAKGVSESLDLANKILEASTSNLNIIAAAQDCSEMLTISLEWLRRIGRDDLDLDIHDIHHWLSAVFTYQHECHHAIKQAIQSTYLSTLSDTNVNASHIKSVLPLISIALSMADAHVRYGSHPTQRHLLTRTHMEAPSADPSWLGKEDRKLLQTPIRILTPSVVVAKDGSGNYSIIQDAVDDAPINLNKRYVVYIKEGVYNEIIRIPSNKTMLALIGDGIQKTVITGNRSVALQPGMTTFQSATLAVSAARFLARGIRVENTAGPAGHQAVALRSESDKAAFYKCAFVGFQDTLNPHTQRQFFKKCSIFGTIDFIFGNAAAIFQDCDIRVRVGAQNISTSVVTAHGRQDPAQATGFVLHNCKIGGTKEYNNRIQVDRASLQAYLGRPWGEYAVTVYLSSKMEVLIQPEGWLAWNGTYALGTLFYGEYRNKGPGANTTQRVPWSTRLNSTGALHYSLQNFIQGRCWLPSTTVPYVDTV